MSHSKELSVSSKITTLFFVPKDFQFTRVTVILSKDMPILNIAWAPEIKFDKVIPVLARKARRQDFCVFFFFSIDSRRRLRLQCRVADGWIRCLCSCVRQYLGVNQCGRIFCYILRRRKKSIKTFLQTGVFFFFIREGVWWERIGGKIIKASQ